MPSRETSHLNEQEVLILGAGIAGLAAARALAERGARVLVLEARGRVGGRVFSQTLGGGSVVELGAEFIHGRAPEMWALLDEAGLITTERGGVMLREDARGGGLYEDTGTEDGDLFSPLQTLAALGHDLSFAEWLRTSEVPEAQHAAIVGYVEGFNAADATRISARSLGLQQRAEEASEGDRAWHVQGGYAQAAEFLARRLGELGGKLRLNSQVVALRWRPGHVEVELRGGERVFAPRCVVTLPLGVLQHAPSEGGVLFVPEPPQLTAARRLAMGAALHFTLLFREPWWQRTAAAHEHTLREMSFLFTPAREIPVWWTAHPEREALPALTGWLGGPRASAFAQRMLNTPVEELGRLACGELAGAFSVPHEQVQASLLSVHLHDWTADPFARGAYSYVPAGALEAPAVMAQSEAGTLFFAGEHTDVTGHWGTVHAALRTGLRAAAQVMGEAQ